MIRAAHIELFNDYGTYVVVDRYGFLIHIFNKGRTPQENREAALAYLHEYEEFLNQPIPQASEVTA